MCGTNAGIWVLNEIHTWRTAFYWKVMIIVFLNSCVTELLGEQNFIAKTLIS